MNVVPGSIVPELNATGSPGLEVTVWGAVSLFVHSTVLFCPIITVAFCGEYVIRVPGF